MRTHGSLIKWNDERGFGFIKPAEQDDALFVHISAFPRDGMRPQIGELISFETETGRDGKLRAARVMRPRSRSRSVRAARPARAAPRWVAKLALLAAVATLGVWAYPRIGNLIAPRPVAQFEPAATRAMPARSASTPASASASFSCDGRTLCTQMTSCAEARFFLQHCPDARMDGDGDGEPCEQQWCN